MAVFKINEKTYTAKPFDFNTVCDLDDMGISVDDMDKKTTSVIRAYFALCAGVDKETAGKEIQKHILNGGDVMSLSKAMGDEIEKSDFFRALNKKTEEKNPTLESEKVEAE